MLVDAKVVIGGSKGKQRFGVITPIRAVTFCCQNIDLVRVKGTEQPRMLRENHHVRLNAILGQELVQYAAHGAVQYADALSVESGRISRDFRICIVFNQIIGFAAHDSVRISDNIFPFFSVSQTCKQINLPIQKHLIQIAESAVDIFILPACILGDLLIVFIGIPGFHQAFARPFLKDFIFIIAHTHCQWFCSG